MRHLTPLAPESNPIAPAPDVGAVAAVAAVADLPAGFEPRRYPIISRHVFNIDPAHAIGRAAAALVADLHFRNKMTVLLAMGNLARKYEAGSGIEPDTGKALKWYRRGAQFGDKSSIELLEELEKRLA